MVNVMDGLHRLVEAGSPTVQASGATLERPVVDSPAAFDVVVLLLVDIKPASRLWGFSRLVRGTAPLRNVPGLKFAKVLGSGRDGGFGVQPSASRQGLFTVFDSEAAADRYIADSEIVRGYRERSSDCCVVKLRAYSCRGSWDGTPLAVSTQAPVSGPIAALTRASIRPRKAFEFWPLADPAQVSLEAAKGCRLAAGLGEAPLLRQATFSVWDSVGDMDNYARQGAHMEAIRRSAAGDFFSESMFVRFKLLSLQGQWKGRRFD